MYIQLTTRCNMRCSHCGFNCTAKGSDISTSTFTKACKIAYECGQDIFLGGGEPTLHPKFLSLLGIAMVYSLEMKVGLVTNGSITPIALHLAQLAREGMIYCALSRDMYHSSIDQRVVQAFSSGLNRYGYSEHNNDYRSIRDVGYNLVAAGRSKDNEDADKKACICNDVFVTPRGKIYACGCKDESYGTVDNPILDKIQCHSECKKTA